MRTRSSPHVANRRGNAGRRDPRLVAGITPESGIMEKLPLVLDLTGTFVFALSGALAGVKRELDLFGVLVLSFAAANSGGITRDLRIGVVPPGAVGDWPDLGCPPSPPRPPPSLPSSSLPLT